MAQAGEPYTGRAGPANLAVLSQNILKTMVAGIPDLLLKMRDDGGDNGNESIYDTSQGRHLWNLTRRILLDGAHTKDRINKNTF